MITGIINGVSRETMRLRLFIEKRKYGKVVINQS